MSFRQPAECWGRTVFSWLEFDRLVGGRERVEAVFVRRWRRLERSWVWEGVALDAEDLAILRGVLSTMVMVLVIDVVRVCSVFAACSLEMYGKALLVRVTSPPRARLPEADVFQVVAHNNVFVVASR